MWLTAMQRPLDTLSPRWVPYIYPKRYDAWQRLSTSSQTYPLVDNASARCDGYGMVSARYAGNHESGPISIAASVTWCQIAFIVGERKGRDRGDPEGAASLRIMLDMSLFRKRTTWRARLPDWPLTVESLSRDLATCVVPRTRLILITPIMKSPCGLSGYVADIIPCCMVTN